MGFVVHRDIEEQVVPDQRRQEPCREAVGVDREAQPRRGAGQLEIAGQRRLEQPHLAGVTGQTRPGRGGDAGRGAHHKRAADPVLERLDALRDRRGRDVQLGSGGIEAAKPEHRVERGQLRRVERH